MNSYLNEELKKMDNEMLIEYVDFLEKSWWTLQGQWMLNVNMRYGTDIATEFDSMVFGKNAEVQAWRLKKLLNLNGTISDLIRIMNLSTIWSNVDFEWKDIDKKKARLKITNCVMQKNRIQLGLPELPCKEPALQVNRGVTKVVNSNIKITCIVCPPYIHEETRWCEWLFEL